LPAHRPGRERARDSQAVQVGYKLAHRLLGDVGALSQAGESRPFSIDIPEDVAVWGPDIGIAGCCETVMELVDDVRERDAQ
jgi:hypothetical protein